MLYLNYDGARMKLNPETGRAAKETLFGIALYTGTITDGLFTGLHDGHVGSSELAERWLAGEDVPRVRIFPAEDIAEYQNELDAAEARRLMGCE